jgi:Domain of unknown function (DUF5666)
MKLVGRRRMAWLGWVVAAVLALSVGGAAFAATQQSGSGELPQPLGLAFAQASGNNQQGNNQQGGKPRLRGGLGKLPGRTLHGQATVQTDQGVKTYVFATGKVTAVSGSSITITSSDNVATTFAINGDTRYGFRNFSTQQAQLKTGQTASVIGTRSGDTNTATRIVTYETVPQQGTR